MPRRNNQNRGGGGGGGNRGGGPKKCPFCPDQANAKPLPQGREACFDCRPEYVIGAAVSKSATAGKWAVTFRTTKNRQAANVDFEVSVVQTGQRVLVPEAQAGYSRGVYVMEFEPSDVKRDVVCHVCADHEVHDALVIPAGGTDAHGESVVTTYGIEAVLTLKDENGRRKIRVETYKNGVLSNQPFDWEIEGGKGTEFVEANDLRFKEGVMLLDYDPSDKPRVAQFHTRQGKDSKELPIPADKKKVRKFQPQDVNHNQDRLGNFLRGLRGH